eukprot:SAG31_NODE_3515_length_4170_cov_7.908131_3_plen_300_part_00
MRPFLLVRFQAKQILATHSHACRLGRLRACGRCFATLLAKLHRGHSKPPPQTTTSSNSLTLHEAIEVKVMEFVTNAADRRWRMLRRLCVAYSPNNCANLDPHICSNERPQQTVEHRWPSAKTRARVTNAKHAVNGYRTRRTRRLELSAASSCSSSTSSHAVEPTFVAIRSAFSAPIELVSSTSLAVEGAGWPVCLLPARTSNALLISARTTSALPTMRFEDDESAGFGLDGSAAGCSGAPRSDSLSLASSAAASRNGVASVVDMPGDRSTAPVRHLISEGLRGPSSHPCALSTAAMVYC